MFGAQIQKWGDGGAMVRLNEGRVAFGDVVSESVGRQNECADQDDDENGEDGVTRHDGVVHLAL
jgi:hypothetical protein